MSTPRHFPPPLIVDEHVESFIVRDDNGQALTYVYFEDEPGRRSPNVRFNAVISTDRRNTLS
ncbi:MAG: hypothetical protein ACLQJ0_25330 [Steroidobacteraceae bacterium]